MEAYFDSVRVFTVTRNASQVVAVDGLCDSDSFIPDNGCMNYNTDDGPGTTFIPFFSLILILNLVLMINFI
jgi:hypothetical protein